VLLASEHLLDQVDAITDDLQDVVPGGRVINWAADLALLPGRFLVGAARTALKGS
jgi:hypothetical protein